MSLKAHFSRGLCVLIFLTTFLVLGNAQDPIFSQFYSSPLQLNPAFAGNSNHPIVYLQYRNQWPSVNNAYVTYSATYDQFLPARNSGFGIGLLRDDAGDGTLTNTKISGVYSYKVQITRDLNLKIGLEGSYVQRRLDFDRLIFADQINPSSGPIFQGGTLIQTTEIRPADLSTGFFDISTGFLLYNPLFYVGLSLEHLTNPSVSYFDGASVVGLPTRFSLHAGAQINFDSGNKPDEGSFITPNVLLVKQGDFYQTNVGFYTKFRALLGGLWYRHTFGNADALIFSLGTTVNQMKIQYSFDYTVSALSINTGGAHELSFRYILENIGENESKINDCLSIFR